MGGKNQEHEVSLQSALNILQALSPEKYKIIPVGIDKSGAWSLLQGKQIEDYFLNPNNPKKIALGENTTPCQLKNEQNTCRLTAKNQTIKIDLVFPVLHGKNAEDGTMQGFLEILSVPYVGSSTLSSTVCFDKATTKILLQNIGIEVAPGEAIGINDPCLSFTQAIKKYGSTLFVKPSQSGSSVGVHKVTSEKDYKQAITDALKYDSVILIESAIKGRELECAVKGNSSIKGGTVQASEIGEVLIHANHEFYDYEAKYTDTQVASTQIPANLTKEQKKNLQEYAVKAYKTLGCDGLARVDMFLTGDNRIYINEVNTLPGFTNISMYPKLWEASGVSYSKLLDELIDLAIQKNQS